MRNKLVGCALSMAWALAMACTVADPVTVYYKLSCAVSLEHLHYVPAIALLLLLAIGWLVVRIAAGEGFIVPLAAAAVSVATVSMSLLGSMDKDSWAINWRYFGVNLGTSLPVATFLAVASIALPWWFWHKSQHRRSSDKLT
jgi:hypothetical protein